MEGKREGLGLRTRSVCSIDSLFCGSVFMGGRISRSVWLLGCLRLAGWLDDWMAGWLAQVCIVGSMTGLAGCTDSLD